MIEKRKRKQFNVNDKQDVEIYRQFLIAQQWKGGCPFVLEFPYTTIPDMIKDKLVKKFLKV